MAEGHDGGHFLESIFQPKYSPFLMCIVVIFQYAIYQTHGVHKHFL